MKTSTNLLVDLDKNMIELRSLKGLIRSTGHQLNRSAVGDY